MTCTPRRPLTVLVSAVALAASLGLTACGRQSEADLTAAARTALQAKDTKAAIIHLKSALQKNAQSGEARFLLGRALLESGDPSAAVLELRKAWELQMPDARVVPELARALLLVGEEGQVIGQFAEMNFPDAAAAADVKTSVATAYAVQGNLDQARSTVEEALRALPSYAPAMIVLARLHAAQGSFDEALALLDHVPADDVARERAGVLKGELLLQGKRDVPAALAAFRQVLATKADSVAARTAVANILLQQDKPAEARAEFEQLKKSAPNHPETLFLEAQFAFKDKNYKLTSEVGDRILKVMPNNVRVLELVGAAELSARNYLHAEAMLTRALKLAPKQPLTQLLLAQTYLRSGQAEKTIDLLRPLVESPAADGASLAIAGEAYLALGDVRRSEEAFQRAVKASPTDARVRTSAALAQMARGNTSAAITDLEALASSDSTPRADLALVSARLRQNDMPGALKALESLERKMPDSPVPHNLRGRVLMAGKDVAGATKSFQLALGKDPAYFPSVASLGAIELASGKPEATRRRFESFLKDHPKSTQARLALAELDARTGATPEAVTVGLREAAKLNPSEPQPHLALVNRLIMLGDGKGALAAAQEAGAALPNNFDITSALGRAQLAAGDSQRAVSTFKQLASQQPRNPGHELRLAEAYMSLKDPESAARSLRRVLELQPDSVPARRGLAAIAMADKRPQDALAIARDLQRIHPKDPLGWLLEGDIEMSRRAFDPAVTAYRAALQRSKSAEAVVKLHTALMDGNKAAEADRLTADWLKDNPKDAGFRYYLGDLALRNNNLAAAEQHYRSVLEIQPEHALALNNVAWLLVKQGKPGGLPLAEKANTLLPNRAPLVDTLATVLEAENQMPKAIEAQKRAIILEPKDPTLVLRLAKMYIKTGEKERARAELASLAQLGAKFGGQAEVSSLMKTL